MATKKSQSLEARVLRAKAFAQTWQEVDPTLDIDDMDLAGFNKVVEALEKSYLLMLAHELQFDDTRKATTEQAKKAGTIEMNVRNRGKIRFGANSVKYGQLGGVRTSDRKSPGTGKKGSKSSPDSNNTETPSTTE